MKSISKNILLLIILTLFLLRSQAQDAHFSQFYANPMYANPAFAGSTYEDRFSIGYRVQWPKLPGEFLTFQAAYDHNFKEYNSSVGFYAVLDQAGTSSIRSINIQGIYAYDLIFDEWGIKTGFQFGYGSRSLDYINLVFGDQLADNGTGLTGNPTNETGLENLSINYIDVSSGVLIYSRGFWLGISAHHLNQPNHSISSFEEQLPMRLSAQLGFKLTKYKKRNRRKGYSMALNPGIFYSQQGDYRQLDIGANGYIDPIILGLWYRGIPIQESANGAVVAMTGFKYKGFRFLYSYDMPIGRFAGLTGGAHEVSLEVKLGDLETKKKFRRNRKPSVPSLVH